MGTKAGCGVSSSFLTMAFLLGGHLGLRTAAFSIDRRKNLWGLASAPSAVDLQHAKKQPRASAPPALAITPRYGKSAARFQVLGFALLNEGLLSTRRRLPKAL